MSEKTGLPVKQEVFLESGMHIGTKIKTNDMRRFIYKKRDDGLYILDIRKSAERLMAAARLLSRYRPEEILVVASRVYSSNPASHFAKLTGAQLVKKRFIPGTLTNIQIEHFKEPKIMLVCDPKGEKSALLESQKNGVPVIGFCDTDNETKYIDLIVPLNNKGRRSLALAFYILTRELLVSYGMISSYDEFKYRPSYFEKPLPDDELGEKKEGTETAVQQQTEQETKEQKQEQKEEASGEQKQEKEQKQQVKQEEQEKPEAQKPEGK